MDNRMTTMRSSWRISRRASAQGTTHPRNMDRSPIQAMESPSNSIPSSRSSSPPNLSLACSWHVRLHLSIHRRDLYPHRHESISLLPLPSHHSLHPSSPLPLLRCFTLSDRSPYEYPHSSTWYPSLHVFQHFSAGC